MNPATFNIALPAFDHVTIGELLGAIGYDHYVSMEQKMVGDERPLMAVEQSTCALLE